MNSTLFIKNLILEKYKTLKNFSEIVDIPQSTLSTMFKNGIGGTSIDTIIKICKELNISIDTISDNKYDPFYVTKQEKDILNKLRQLPPQELDKIIGMIELKIYEFCSKKNDLKEEA